MNEAFADGKRTGILLVSRADPSAFGGLPAYFRGLAGELEREGLASPELVSTRCATPSRVGRPVAVRPDGDRFPKFWMRLASRPVFHSLLERLIVLREAPWLLGCVERPIACIHWIGTGWDFWGFAARAVARRHGARFAVWPAVHPHRWGDDRIDLRLYSAADAVFCQSRHEEHHLTARGLPSTAVTRCALPPLCLPDGNPGGFRQQFGLGEKKVVLFLGRREAGKGYGALLDAWASVRARCPEAVLAVAGPGESCREPGCIDLGTPDELEKAEALAGCDVFCLPSAEESFGIAYAEAWSYAKPVVCGPAPAVREWVRDAENGLWTDGSPGEIAKVLEKLLGNAGLCQRLGAAGKSLQASELTWDRTLDAHARAFGLHD